MATDEDPCALVDRKYGTDAESENEEQAANAEIVVNDGEEFTCVMRCDGSTNLKLYMQFGVGVVSPDCDQVDDCNEAMECGQTLTIACDNCEAGFGYRWSADTWEGDLELQCGGGTCDLGSEEVESTGDGGGGGGGGCFSGEDTVQVLGKGNTPMKDLQVGDKILTDQDKYEPVYSFGHYHETKMADFVKIQTANKDALTMTPNHLIFQEVGQAVRADAVEVGDALASGAAVQKVSKVQKKGLYMPLTPSGKLLVNNIETSAYISMAEYAPIQQHPLLKFWLSEHVLSHLWLSPYRMYCMGVSSNYCSNFAKNVDGDEGIMSYLLMGKKVAEIALEQNLAVQILMGIPVFGTLLAFQAIESITGPSMAPLALIVAAAIIVRRFKKAGQKQKTV